MKCFVQVGEVGADWFCVYLIPETLRATTMGNREQGDLVNIEIDARTQVYLCLTPFLSILHFSPAIDHKLSSPFTTYSSHLAGGRDDAWTCNRCKEPGPPTPCILVVAI